ncbi:MAG: FAD:protein FMN transferase [Pseudomonadota bacterium]
MLIIPAASAEWLRQHAAIMGTDINVELWYPDAVKGRDLIEAVLDEMRRIDRLMSTYRPDSEISRINDTAANQPVTVGSELFHLIEQALEYSGLTSGAFDITYASAGYLYDYRNQKKPDENQLAAALPAIDYRHVVLDAANQSVSFTQPGVRIDLGGIAKGYAVDRCISILQTAGVANALVSAGGDTRVIGRHWDHPWVIGIRDPRKRDGIVTRIPLENMAISTSGDYERYFEQDGVRYHHILNPGTGRSPHEIHSTTIIGENATRTDALSTSIFVLGVQQGLELVNRLPDVEAIIIDAAGKLHYSNGLARLTDAR